jgi:hypothetical protein
VYIKRLEEEEEELAGISRRTIQKGGQTDREKEKV